MSSHWTITVQTSRNNVCMATITTVIKDCYSLSITMSLCYEIGGHSLVCL